MGGALGTPLTVCQRRCPRHRILHSEGADVEFVLGDGRRQRSPVLDISAGGLSFALPDGAPAFEPGTRLDAVVHLGDRHIRGRLTVAHATAEFAAGLGVVERVDVLPFHQMGRSKWHRLGMGYTLESAQPPTVESVERTCEIFRRVGLRAY